MPKKETDVLCKITCNRCGKESYVPFVADGSRSYYCADCLKEFNAGKKRGTVKQVTDPKGRRRYEYICDVCLRLRRAGTPPRKDRDRLICGECAEKEARERKASGRKRVVIAKKGD
ncbi:MAG TPA: hypothetical protein P5077_07170 [bacterium]|nr:hypothetical protein [bacterium]